MTALYADTTAPAGGLVDHLNAENAGTAEAPAEVPGRYADVELADGTRYTVRVINRDYVLWDKTATKHRFGSATDTPFRFSTFLAWAASTREGLYEGRFADFEDRDAVEIESRTVARADGEDTARPTR